MAKKLIKDPARFFWHGLFWPLLAWVFIVPLAFLMPRKRNRIVFYGRDRGLFADNVKYLFLHAHLNEKPKADIVFLTEHPDVLETLGSQGMPVLRYPTFHGIWALLRAGVLVTDSDGWISKFRYHLLFRAFKVQLWHGVGLKTIGLSNPRNKEMLKHPVMRAYFRLKGKLVSYDLLVTTGDAFVEQGYPTGLIKKRTVPTGYPRNDVFFHDFQGLESVGVDQLAVERIRAFRNDGGKVAAYLPTFRDSGQDAVSCRVLDIARLDQFCQHRNVLMIFKFHSWGMLKEPEMVEAMRTATNIVLYDHAGDIYPVLPHVDVLISDLSSVYMDYLLLDRPILFFTFAIEDYMQNERDFYFPYDDLTPGLKCRTQAELEDGLDRCLAGSDGYSDAREALARRTFNQRDGNASERIWACIAERRDGYCQIAQSTSEREIRAKD